MKISRYYLLNRNHFTGNEPVTTTTVLGYQYCGYSSICNRDMKNDFFKNNLNTN